MPRELICGVAAFLLVLGAAGCGGGGKTSEPAEHHLVYIKGNGVNVPVDTSSALSRGSPSCSPRL